MKRMLASFILIAAASLSGCYYDPGYSYVRSSGYGGDAYYGQSTSTYYAAPGYYDGYYPGYYGGGYYSDGYYGCCYAPSLSIGISSGWYGGSRHYRRDRDDGYRGHYRSEGRGYAPQRSGVRVQARPPASSSSRRVGEPRRSRRGDHRN